MSRRGKLTAILAVIVLALLSGCASSVATHDATHDEALADGLASLQSSTGRFFDQLQQVIGTPDADWVVHAAWYEETRTEIAALRFRATASGAMNDSTLDALALLDQSVAELETAHAWASPPRRFPCCARCSTRSCACSSSWKPRKRGRRSRRWCHDAGCDGQ